MFLLDTNVVSDPVGRRPSDQVAAWLSAQDASTLFLSTLTIAEIEFGIARLEASRHRSLLLEWRDQLFDAFRDRIIPIDADIALVWGRVRARADHQHRTMPILDAVLAATAEIHALTVVTRNTKDFEVWGGPVLNPWGEDRP